MINLNQLRIFYFVAKNLSFTKAAGDLFITQPAVTAQIKSFENQLGFKLFKKRGRKIFLTGESDVLYEYAEKIFTHEKNIENVIDDLKKLKRGVLHIGAARTYARYFMPFLMSRYLQDYPDIRIKLSEGSSLEMIGTLLNVKNEIAIIARTETTDDLCFIPFSREELVLILPRDHRLAQKKSIRFKELSEVPIIMKESGSGTRKRVNELFAQHSCSPNVLMETSNAEFIKQLVQRGDGISFLLNEAVKAELTEKKLKSVPLKDCKMFIDVNIAYLADQPLSPPAEAFFNLVMSLKSENTPLLKISDLKAKISAQNHNPTIK